MKTPKSVYRRFKEKEWADDLLKGVVWLPTFASIRDPEHPRADVAEGTAKWEIPDLTPDAPREKALQVLTNMEKVGFLAGDVATLQNVTFKNCVHTSEAHGYVLCTSRNAKLKQFGPHCVRIMNPDLFGNLIFSALEELFGSGGQGAHGWVPYGRVGSDIQPPNPYFVGTDNNKPEEEYRFVFLPNAKLSDLQPIRLEIPVVSRLCSRA